MFVPLTRSQDVTFKHFYLWICIISLFFFHMFFWSTPKPWPMGSLMGRWKPWLLGWNADPPEGSVITDQISRPERDLYFQNGKLTESTTLLLHQKYSGRKQLYRCIESTRGIHQWVCLKMGSILFVKFQWGRCNKFKTMWFHIISTSWVWVNIGHLLPPKKMGWFTA